MQEKFKLLIISYSFYPDDSPNTYRWKSIVDSWQNQNVEIIVISAQKKGLKQFEIADGIKIYRTGRTHFQRLKTKLGQYSDNNLVINNETGRIKKKSLLRTIYNHTWPKLYWPDWAFIFYSPTLKLAKQIIRSENITNLITVSWPFTDHMIGYKLKQQFGILWHAEIIDPFSFNESINNHKLYRKLNFLVERKILKATDSISVMTDRISRKYSLLFPEIKNKIHVVHNIYVPNNKSVKLSLEVQEKNNYSNIKTLVFMGSLSPDVRNPDDLLKIFSQLLEKDSTQNYELHFYGKINSEIKVFNQYTNLINKNIFIHGSVSKDKVTPILQDATILINIGNNNEFQEPSKIIEYVYLGKPIINICSIENDSSKEILDKYPLKFYIHKEDLGSDITIRNLINFINDQNKVDSSNIANILSPYLVENIEKTYYKLIFG